jgi:hypothetical protein
MSAILLSSDKPEDIRLLTELAERLGVRLFKIQKLPTQVSNREAAKNQAAIPVISDELVVELLEEIQLEYPAQSEEIELWKAELRSKPLREIFDAEAIKREQHWQGQHDKPAIMQLIGEMDIEEPIETLLAQLTK